MGSRHRSLLTCDTRVFWLQYTLEKKSTQEYQMVEILEELDLGDKMLLTLMMCYLHTMLLCFKQTPIYSSSSDANDPSSEPLSSSSADASPLSSSSSSYASLSSDLLSLGL